MDMKVVLDAAKAAYDIEAACITEMKDYFDDEQFGKAVELLANARQRLIAATGNKIGKAGFSRICDSDESIRLITDATCDRDAYLALQELGVQASKV